MEETKKEMTAPANEENTISGRELFLRCIDKAVAEFKKERREAVEAYTKRGFVLRRGGYERMNWNHEWIADQYELCLNKECKEPTAIRQIIVIIGNRAQQKFNDIVANLIKQQQEREAKQKSEAEQAEKPAPKKPRKKATPKKKTE